MNTRDMGKSDSISFTKERERAKRSIIEYPQNAWFVLIWLIVKRGGREIEDASLSCEIFEMEIDINLHLYGEDLHEFCPQLDREWALCDNRKCSPMDFLLSFSVEETNVNRISGGRLTMTSRSTTSIDRRSNPLCDARADEKESTEDVTIQQYHDTQQIWFPKTRLGRNACSQQLKTK